MICYGLYLKAVFFTVVTELRLLDGCTIFSNPAHNVKDASDAGCTVSNTCTITQLNDALFASCTVCNNCIITQLNDTSFAGCTHLITVQSRNLMIHHLQAALT